MFSAHNGNIYAILSATAPDSTLHANERDWCVQFADEWRLLTADGLTSAGAADFNPPNTVGAKTLARRVSADADHLRWADDTVYVLVDGDRLDHETADPFRRSLRVVLDRLSADVVFPYDDLDAGERGAWLIECMEKDELLPTGRHYSGNEGVDEDQRGLDSF